MRGAEVGIRLLSQVWEKEIRGPARDVLMVYCDYANDDGRVAWPTLESVAWKAGYSIRQVQRIVKQLRADDVLRQVKTHDGRQEGVRYYVNLSAIPNKSARVTGDIAVSPVTNQTGDIAVSGGRVTQLCRGTGDTAMSPKPPITTNTTTKGDAGAPRPPQPVADTPPDTHAVTPNASRVPAQNPTPSATTTLDPIQHLWTRATKTPTPAAIIAAWKGAPHLLDLCAAFAEATGVEVTKGDRAKWLGGAARLYELRPTKGELVAARDYAAKSGFPITHPAAAVETVKALRQKTRAPAAANPSGRKIVDWQQLADGSMKPVYAECGATAAPGAQGVPA